MVEKMNHLELYDLKCLGRKHPVGIDVPPEFSWKLKSSRKDVFQKSFQIDICDNHGMIVASTGIVESENEYRISVPGFKASEDMQYIWKVTVTDNHGETASGKDYFTTGILNSDFWRASWVESGKQRKPVTDSTDSMAIFAGMIKPDEEPERKLDSPVYFRKEFTIGTKPIQKATVYATARGIYSLSVDGKKISSLLAPEYTSYAKHLEYQIYDVTEILKGSDTHAIGAILADGWFTGKIGLMGIGNQYGDSNAFMFQLKIQYEDDSVECVCSDENMKWSEGSYIYADLFVGEYVDMRKALQGYDCVEYDDAAWKPVVIKEYGYDNLKAQSVEPAKILRYIRPSLICTPKGELVLDAGENICGFTKFELNTPESVTIELEHSEVLDHEGNFLQNIMGQNKNQKDRVITVGGKTVYEPQFTFHGFRYVKVTGLEEIEPKDFTICVIGSPMDETGDFSCSNELLNKLQENIIRSQQGNMLCIPTDCPQRERAGWTGDMQIFANTATFNMQVSNFIERWLYDMRLEQLDDGQIPNIIPYIDSDKYVGNGDGKHISSAGWGDACVIVPYALYRAYGDKNILRDNYQMMTGWMNYIESQAGDDMSQWGKLFHFGDWLIPSIVAETHNPIETAIRTKEEAALALYAYVINIMIDIATVLDYSNDVDKYIAILKKIKETFSTQYVSEDGEMKQGLQGLYVLALSQHLLTEKQRKGAVNRLCALIEQADYCLDTGFVSIPFLLDTLCENGKSDIAYKILQQTKPPSWLYAVTKGATTIWENWAAILPNGIRTNSSYNHFAFGCVGDFMYRKIGGINIEESGYKKVLIAPDLKSGITWAKTQYDSIHGKISVEWKNEGTEKYIKVVLPPNASGTVVFDGKTMQVGNGEFVITS
jgi:alpha-L-rhamnosidase